tara:strand:+ start:108 stop:260 length:153 start_codon:yes stop_codon:yes gene_type:complete
MGTTRQGFPSTAKRKETGMMVLNTPSYPPGLFLELESGIKQPLHEIELLP